MAIKNLFQFSVKLIIHYGRIFDCDRIDFVQRLKHLKLTLVILDYPLTPSLSLYSPRVIYLYRLYV